MEIIKPAEFLSFLDRTLIGKLQSWLQGNGNQKIRGAVIGQAIILATVGIFLYKMMTPPAQLRHLPTINPLRLMYSFVSKEEPGSRANRLVLPTVLKHHSKGYVSTLVGKWTIIITDPVAARAFLLKTENFPKNQSILSTLEDSHPLVKFAGRSNIVFSNGEVWKNQRKAMNPPFHRAMPVDLFGNIMLKVYKKIDEHQGKPVVAIDIMERMTLDALSLGLFAFDFNALDDEDSPYVKTYERIRTDLRDPLVFIVPKLDSIVKYFRSSRERLVCDVDKLNKLLLDMANKRRQEIRDRRAQSADIPDSQKDLLTLIMEGELDGVLGLATNEELRANLAIFFLAGHETTANSLAFALYHLAKYPDVQRKARQEVINVLGDEHEDVLPTTEQLKQLKYIDMIIKENLRLTNPAAFINSRKALQEMYVGDVYIPKGASVTVDLTAIHRHPGIWDRPNDFIPERFAEGAEAERQKGLAWLPFSNGGRQCIGMNFSLAEQRVALSMLLRKYEWSLPEDSVHKDHLRIKHFAFMAPKDLTITFRNRY